MDKNLRPVVLIVDDEEIYRYMIGEYLSTLEIEIRYAGSTTEGKINLEHHHVDLIVCDYRMDDGTGLDVLEYVKRTDMHTPFILCTNMDESKIPHISYLKFSFVRKTEMKRLLEEVRRYLGVA